MKHFHMYSHKIMQKIDNLDKRHRINYNFT